MSDRSTTPAAAGTAVPDADADDPQGDAPPDDADAEPRSPGGPAAPPPGARPC